MNLLCFSIHIQQIDENLLSNFSSTLIFFSQETDMAKVGKLTKLKSLAMKRLPSFTKLARTNSSSATAQDSDDHHHHHHKNNDNNSSKELHAVYVGKSRRRYFLSSEVICHPLFQELIERSGGFDDNDGHGQVVVACEVVLFEHLLWMLESSGAQLESLHELAEFYYTC